MADRVRFKGTTSIWAGGKVTIDRSDFAARADSMRLDTGDGQRRHPDRRRAGPPRTRHRQLPAGGEADRPGARERELSRLVARGEGHAREQGLGPDRRHDRARPQQAEARAAPSPGARRPGRMPSPRLRHAGRLARARLARAAAAARSAASARRGSAATSTRPPRSATGCAGDTVIAQFAPSDSAGKKRAVLSRIDARVGRPIVPPRPQRQGAQAALDQLRPGRRHHRHHEERRARRPASTGSTSGARWTASSSRPAPIRSPAGPDTPKNRSAAGDRARLDSPRLGDRDPSVAIAPRRHHPGRRARATSSTFAELLMSYREAHLACYRAIGSAQEQEITGDEIRDHLDNLAD